MAEKENLETEVEKVEAASSELIVDKEVEEKREEEIVKKLEHVYYVKELDKNHTF